jgi:propionyl-CoA synthetase
MGDTMQAISDIGWVVGHSFIVYGPLLVGAKSVVYEGKPITPNAGKIWEMIARYNSKTLFLAPTAVRILKKMDFDGHYIRD